MCYPGNVHEAEEKGGFYPEHAGKHGGKNVVVGHESKFNGHQHNKYHAVDVNDNYSLLGVVEGQDSNIPGAESHDQGKYLKQTLVCKGQSKPNDDASGGANVHKVFNVFPFLLRKRNENMNSLE